MHVLQGCEKTVIKIQLLVLGMLGGDMQLADPYGWNHWHTVVRHEVSRLVSEVDYSVQSDT